MSAEPFVWPVRVYYEDTDAGGVVYHARYLHFLERARTEWLRSIGIDQSRLKRERGLVFVVSRLSLSFRRPAKLKRVGHLVIRPVIIAIEKRLQLRQIGK